MGFIGLKPSSFKVSIILLILLSSLMGLSHSLLIDEKVTQQSFINPYPQNMQFYHPYFDVSFKDGGSLI